MPKEGTPRRTMTSGRPAAQRRQTGPAPASSPEGISLASLEFHDDIAARAYEIFLARGGQHGDDWADWLQAEAEVLGKTQRGDSTSRK